MLRLDPLQRQIICPDLFAVHVYIYFYSCPFRPYSSEKRSSLFNFKSPFQIKLNHGVLDRTHHLHQSTLILPSPLLSLTFLPLNALVCADVWLKKKQHFISLHFNTRATVDQSFQDVGLQSLLTDFFLPIHRLTLPHCHSLLTATSRPLPYSVRKLHMTSCPVDGREKNMTPFIRSASISAPLFFSIGLFGMFHRKTFHPSHFSSQVWKWSLTLKTTCRVLCAFHQTLTYSGMKKVFDVTPALPFPIICAVSVTMISNTASGVVTSSPLHIDEHAHKL